MSYPFLSTLSALQLNLNMSPNSIDNQLLHNENLHSNVFSSGRLQLY